jgi:hypothetical protein
MHQRYSLRESEPGPAPVTASGVSHLNDIAVRIRIETESASGHAGRDVFGVAGRDIALEVVMEALHQHLPAGPDCGFGVLARAAGGRNNDAEKESDNEPALQRHESPHDRPRNSTSQLSHRDSRPDQEDSEHWEPFEPIHNARVA